MLPALIKLSIIFYSMQLMAETMPVSSVNYDGAILNIIDVIKTEALVSKACNKKSPQHHNKATTESVDCIKKSALKLVAYDKDNIILPNISLSDRIKEINAKRAEAFKKEISEEQIIVDDIAADIFTTTLLGLEGLTNLLFTVTEREKYKKDVTKRETDFADINNVFTNSFLRHYFPETKRIYHEYSFKSGFSNRNHGDVMGIRIASKQPIPLAFQELEKIKVAEPLFTDDYNYYAYFKKIAILVGLFIFISLFRKN